MTKGYNSNSWTISYNETHPYDRIVKELYSNSMASVYILQSRRELRMLADTRTFNFLKDKLMPMNFKHVANITDCFELGMPSYDGEDHEYCVISEPLNRDIIGRDITQSGINLFRDSWKEYLHCLEWHVYNYIIDAYTQRGTVDEEKILRIIETSGKSQEEINIAKALNGAYRDTLQLGTAMIWPYPINIGLSDDAIIKITNIGIR